MKTRTYTPPNIPVTFEMFAFRTVRVDMVIADVETIIPTEKQNTYHRIFTTLEGYTRNISFGDNLPDDWQGLREYWQARTRDTAANFDRFFELVSTEVAFVWWDAWKATRDIDNAAPPELSKEAEVSENPLSVSDVNAPSQTSAPNGNKKPQKALLQQAGLTPGS